MPFLSLALEKGVVQFSCMHRSSKMKEMNARQRNRRGVLPPWCSAIIPIAAGMCSVSTELAGDVQE